MLLQQLSEIEIDVNQPLVFALKLMNSKEVKLLIVLDKGDFRGLISIGDIQRYIIQNAHIDCKVGDACRLNPLVASVNEDECEIKQKMHKDRIEFMPILDMNKKLVKVIFWDDLFNEDRSTALKGVPVVIMAGGRGTRLKPFTNVFPKPLMPLGDRTIIERVINQFSDKGANDFFITVNHKSKMIEFYFSELEAEYEFRFIQENQPLGTAGSLYLLAEDIHSTFFVSNCDVLLEEDMSKILSFHLENKNDITIVSSMYNFTLPYGTLITESGGVLKTFSEKPETFHQINTGIYVLEPRVLKYIPQNEFFHITDLITIFLDSQIGKVGVYPVNWNAWMDIGQWNEYRRTAQRFGDTFE